MELRDEDLFPGTRFTAYQGTGDLIVDCGNERLLQPCEFVCGQMADGRLICHCFWSEGELNLWELLRCEQREGAFRLFGRTEDGLPVSAHCLRHTNFTSSVVYEGRSYRNIASFNAQQIFVSETLRGLSALDERWGFRKAVLSFVDAVITTDFIEARGLKAAVTLDFFCGRFREVAEKRTLLAPSLFKRWSKTVKASIRQLSGELLERAGTGPQTALVDEMLKHLPGLNYYAFATSLGHLLQHLRLDVDPAHVKRLVAIRNKLVHEVQYPSRRLGTQAMVDDYHLLQRFVVQILLALVRYTGQFNDWTRLATADGAEHGLRVPMRYANRLEEEACSTG